jgi:hypothetical protein
MLLKGVANRDAIIAPPVPHHHAQIPAGDSLACSS